MNIAPLSPTRAASIIAQDGGNGWNRREEHWLGVLAQIETGQRATMVAVLDAQVVGYGSILWRSGHPGFASAGVPEVHDLATDVQYRGEGIATRLIATLEDLARQHGHKVIGLGVGLYADYGPAQRLYARLGYLPDGHGVTYRQSPVVPGATFPIDDDLLPWLTKRL